MPVIRRKDVPADEGLGGNSVQPLARAELGTESLTVSEVTVPPGGSIPLHTHPGHEEVMVVSEGTLQAALGDETTTVVVGDTVIAPDGETHGMTNTSGRPAKILAIFPTTDVQRRLVEG